MSLNNTGRIITTTIVFTLALATGIFYGTLYAPQKYENRRLTDCIHALADYQNTLNHLARSYGVAEFRYDPERDRCLYRSNYAADENGGHYFEKFMVDTFTGETLADYAERDGVPVKGNLTAFNTAIDTWFPASQ